MSNIQLHTRHPQSPAWLNSVKLQRQASWLLRQLQIKNRSLCIVLVNDHEISQLNSQFRQKNGPTNVLSFPASTGTPDPFPGQLDQELGDIVISLDTAAHEAISLQQSPDQRLSWLLTHGILHLLGWDHERSPDEAEAMYTLEQQLLTRLTHHRRTAMTRLAINVDHIATIRQARGGKEPDPVTAAAICELAGAMGIVVHLREDRRHIQDRDLFLLRQTVKSKLNLEMAAAPQIIDIALRVKPDLVTLVPEKRQELTTEGGLNVQTGKKKIAIAIEQLHQGGIPVSLFIDPEEQQIATSSAIGADFVELHTGWYCEANNEDEQHQLCTQLAEATEQACQLGLKVNAGHGLDYRNTAQIAAIDGIEELSIGHAIISRAAFVGLDQAVREMLAIIRTANSLL